MKQATKAVLLSVEAHIPILLVEEIRSMLLESAFYKLPELMMTNTHNRGRVEAMVVQYMATGLQMELDCRSIPFAYNHVIVEKPYPNQKEKGSYLRADLLFSASGTIPTNCLLDLYGYKDQQWLEAKTFFSKKNSKPAKTQNIGRVVKDFIRLCLLPEAGARRNGRYMLMVFDRHPSQYLASQNRDWVKELIENKNGELVIDLSKEPKSLINSIVNSDTFPLILKIKFNRHHFEPCENNSYPLHWGYWGYLYRIEAWSITIGDDTVECSGNTEEHWSKENVEKFEKIKQIFLQSLSK